MLLGLGLHACRSRAAGTHLQVNHQAQRERHLVELVQAASQEEGRPECVLVAIWCRQLGRDMVGRNS